LLKKRGYDADLNNRNNTRRQKRKDKGKEKRKARKKKEKINIPHGRLETLAALSGTGIMRTCRPANM